MININNVLNFKKNNLYYKGEKISYGISDFSIEETNEIVFHMKIESNNESLDVEFEAIDHILSNILKNNGFSITILWNDVYFHYTNKLYPLISKIENKARKLITFMLTKAGGTNWKNSHMPQVEKQKAKQVESEGKGFYEKNILYNLDFIDISVILFKPYQFVNDNNMFNKDLKSIRDKNEDEICEFLKKYEYKNNWDRFFADKVNDRSIAKDWDDLYLYRNKVAHNKDMGKDDFKKANVLIERIENVLLDIENKLDDVVIEPADAHSMMNYTSLLLSLSQKLKEYEDDYSSKLSEALGKIMLPPDSFGSINYINVGSLNNNNSCSSNLVSQPNKINIKKYSDSVATNDNEKNGN